MCFPPCDVIVVSFMSVGSIFNASEAGRRPDIEWQCEVPRLLRGLGRTAGESAADQIHAATGGGRKVRRSDFERNLERNGRRAHPQGS